MSSPKQAWQPSATCENLIKRAAIISKIRGYFAESGVIEVTTPCLGSHTVTDPQTHSMSAQREHAPQKYFLQTSPEYAMKRLLAAGMPSIYQIGPVFRDDIHSPWHQCEFTMLEWYRVGYNDAELRADIAALLAYCGVETPCVSHSYCALFQKYCHFDPTTADDKLIRQWVETELTVSHAVLDSPRDTLLQLCFTHVIEPKLNPKTPTFVIDFPASQAALARIHPHNPLLAKRFELYWGDQEIGNGFDELCDPDCQTQRFKQDQQHREALGLAVHDIDPNFIASLQAGLPVCAGMAIGIERLLAILMQKDTIADVMSFATH